MASALQMPRGNAEHGERRRQIETRHRVREAIGKRWTEYDGQPIGGHEAAVDDLVARGSMHPTVGGENPERGKQRTGRDHDRCEQVSPWWNALASEKHDTEKACFQKKGHHALVREKRAENVTRYVGVAAPVRAELERHHDAGHDAHAERHGEDPGPEHRQAQIDRIALDDVQSFKQNDERCEP